MSWCEPPVNTPRWADQSPLSSATVNISHLCSAALSCVDLHNQSFSTPFISERLEMVVMVMTCVSLTLDQEQCMINVMRYCLRYGAIVQPSKLFRWKQCFCSRVTWTGSLVQFQLIFSDSLPGSGSDQWYFCADSGYFSESEWGGSEEVVSNVEQVVLSTTWSREEGQQH